MRAAAQAAFKVNPKSLYKKYNMCTFVMHTCIYGRAGPLHLSHFNGDQVLEGGGSATDAVTEAVSLCRKEAKTHIFVRSKEFLILRFVFLKMILLLMLERVQFSPRRVR